jgi:arylsulfatase A-like enzyme
LVVRKGLELGFIFILGAVVSCTEKPPTDPVNIILISIDSLRSDHVHSYNYPRETTPTLDRLAREGTLFENAVAESSWTLPTHMTMLTGLPAETHGVEYFSGSRLSELHPTLAEILRDRGYRTFGVFSGPYLHPVFGFGRGFEHYESAIGETVYDDQSFDPSGSEADTRIKRTNFMAHRNVTSSLITEKAIEFLAEAKNKRFFLFLHYFDVHFDYIPPEELWRKFDPDYQGTMTGEHFQQNNEINARNGLGDRTLVLVTSDHGVEFFEHGKKGHYRTLFDEVLMVPLIMRMPGRVRAGVRISEQVRHLDILPTLLSFAGISDQEELLGDVGGSSLAGVLEGTGPPRSLAAVSSLRRSGYWLSLRTPGLKYIVNRHGPVETELLFDLERDPGELEPVLWREQNTRGEGFQEKFGDLRRALLRKEALALAARVAPEGAEKDDVELPAEVREELRALGYIQ